MVLSATSTSFVTQMKAAAGSLDDFANKSDATAARTEASAGRLSKVFLGLGVAVAAALLGAVAAASSFETQMRNVSSLGGVTESTFKQMSASVLDLSRTLPQSATDLAKGLYDIASSGFQGAEGLEVLEASAKAASAGLATTAEAAKAVTAVLNAYGLESSDAARVSDILFQTVNLGVVSFSELTGVIGDVVGSAAAAGVSIDQVGAAIATMTLSGVTASEAGTSLNRVLQSFIKPSDEMALALRSIGYESGVSALKQDGLRGVMDKLRVATGGNVEVTVQLFDEIRAARGALALMADEGQNYARVVDGMTQATEGAGATQRAFAEQSKALSFQLKTAKNEIMALVIEGATPLLGFLKDGIAGLREMAQAAGPGLGRALQALQPFFSGLVAVGGDLVTVLREAYVAVGPLAGALLTIAGGAVIGALNALAGSLEALTGFAADHSEIVAALAIVYGVNLAVGVAGATAQFALWRLSAIASTVASSGLVLGIQQQVHYFGLLGLAIRAVPYVALIGGITATLTGIANAKSQADELVGNFQKGVDLTTQSGLDEYLSKIVKHKDALSDVTNEGNRFSRFLRSVYEFATPAANSLADATEGFKELEKAEVAAGRASVSLSENVATISSATGLSAKEVEALAKTLGVDLTESFGKAGPARKAVIDDFNKIGQAAKEVGVDVKAGSLSSKEAIEAFAAEIEATRKLLDGVRDAFRKDTDAIGGYSKFLAEATKGNEAFNAAQEKLIDAQADLRDLQARQAVDTKISVSDQQALAKAHDKVAEAQRGVAEAADDLKGADLSSFYAENTAKAQKFADDIEELARRGLDPAVIMRLMQAGPEAAAPYIQGILTSNNANIISIVNDGEKALATITQKVVANARLTQMAINDAFSDQKVKDLALAMEVSAASIDSSGTLTRQAIADKIGKPLADVIRVVDSFKITVAGMPGSINPATTAADALAASLRSIEGTYRATVDVDTRLARASIEDLKASLAALEGRASSAAAAGRSTNQERIAQEEVREELAEPSEQPYQGAGAQQATGGILGQVVALAGGGRTKGFRTQGPTYLVGEGDPNWEEYVIASDPRYAQRNRKLWTMAGKRIGMLAEGGVTGTYQWETNAIGEQELIYMPPGWTPAIGASNIAAARAAQANPSYPSHQASSLVSRSYSGSANSQDFRGMMEDVIRAVEGMGHNITIEVDGDVIARVAAKGLAKMDRALR